LERDRCFLVDFRYNQRVDSYSRIYGGDYRPVYLTEVETTERGRILKTAGAIVVGIAAVVVVLFLLVFGGGLFSMATSDFRGEVEKHENVEANGRLRVEAYEEFYGLCSSIQTKQTEIETAQAQADAATDPEEKNRWNSVVVANTNQRNELINEYNSKSSQDYTVGQFKDSDLPYRIDPDDKDVECE
jgi:hypothetical protein